MQAQAQRKRPAEALQAPSEAPKRPKWVPAHRPTLSELLSRKAVSEPQLSLSQTSEDDVPLSRVVQRLQNRQTQHVQQNRHAWPKAKEIPAQQSVKHANEQGETVFQLSAKRRLTLRKWKNLVLVDVREFYDDNGTMKPGKKGISLSLEQWNKLVELADAVTEAIECVEDDRIHETSLSRIGYCIIGPDGDKRAIAFPLSAKRRLTVRFFRNGVLVDLREFYDQDGVAKPGKKGISLSKDQWAALQQSAAEVSSLAERL